MIAPLFISYLFNENVHDYFIEPILLCLVIGVFSFRKLDVYDDISFKESILIVVLTWLGVSSIGALPFHISHYFPTYIDSFFESVSGFTATGSTVLSDIEAVPKSLLFWRSETHWLGGMGIIVLALAIFPTMKGKIFLFESEAPVTPDEQKLFPRISEVAKTYWKIYTLLTLVQIVLLLFALSPYDAITHAFSSIAGGGFSTKNNSVAYFNSFYVEFILSLFMIIGATSFILHYYGFRGKFYRYWRNTSFRLFIAVIFISTMFITLNLFLSKEQNFDFISALRVSFFQVVSIITTTGFATSDFKYWPQTSQAILILLMFVGGMSASTSGSIKVSRFEVIIKSLKSKFIQPLHPKAITSFKIGVSTLKNENITKVYVFVFAYIIIFLGASLILTALEQSPTIAFSAVAATLGNVGPGLGQIGPLDNFLPLTAASKLILSGCMVIGRLEIWTFFLVLTPEFWMA
ncbi:MAG: TrkH family potassium uptake protein [Melioribacteraceae bacterium]|nr:TrkH family potassium uptake protein [Melioribacteraceae bacterium]